MVPLPGETWPPCAMPAGLAEALGLAGSGSAAGDGWPDADVAAFEAGLARNGKDFDDTVAEVRAPSCLQSCTSHHGRYGRAWGCVSAWPAAGLQITLGGKSIRKASECLLVTHLLLAQPVAALVRAELRDSAPSDRPACGTTPIGRKQGAHLPRPACAAAAAPHVRPAGGLLLRRVEGARTPARARLVPAPGRGLRSVALGFVALQEGGGEKRCSRGGEMTHSVQWPCTGHCWLPV